MKKLFHVTLISAILLSSTLLFIHCDSGFDPEITYPEGTGFSCYWLTFSTSSDWAKLVIADSTRILTQREFFTNDDSNFYDYHEGTFWIYREQADTQTVGIMSVQIAIAAETIASPLRVHFERGDIGSSTLEISTARGDLHSYSGSHHIQHRLIVPDDPTNSFDTTLSLKVSHPTYFASSLPRPEKRVIAYYYPWYPEGIWDSEQLLDKPLERYVSADTLAIRRHIQQAKSAGIDGWSVSWWGPESPTDILFPIILAEAEAQDFSVHINLEILDDTTNEPQPPQVVQGWIRYIVHFYGLSPAYEKVDDRPVITVWASQAHSNETWETLIQNLHAEENRPFLLAHNAENFRRLDYFDGIYEYCSVGLDDPASIFDWASFRTRNYHLLDDEPSPRIWVASVYPGYDDHLLPGREGWVRNRADGQFYIDSWETAVASEPDWIFITSWNEYWENTHIEPSENYGNSYLTLTDSLINSWKQ